MNKPMITILIITLLIVTGCSEPRTFDTKKEMECQNICINEGLTMDYATENFCRCGVMKELGGNE